MALILLVWVTVFVSVMVFFTWQSWQERLTLARARPAGAIVLPMPTLRPARPVAEFEAVVAAGAVQPAG